jgi:hypothetical protein
MATARCTSERRGQKLDAHCVSTLQDKLLTPDKEEDGHTRGHLFIFFFVPISPFYYKCNTSHPLGTIEGEAGATSRRETSIETDPCARTHLTDQVLKLIYHQRDLGSTPL